MLAARTTRECVISNQSSNKADLGKLTETALKLVSSSKVDLGKLVPPIGELVQPIRK